MLPLPGVPAQPPIERRATPINLYAGDMDRGDRDLIRPPVLDVGEPDRHFAAECRIWNSLIGVYPGPCDPNTLSPRPARAIPLVVVYEVPRMR